MPVLNCRNLRLVMVLLAAPVYIGAAQPEPDVSAPATAVTARDVLAHLEQTIAWYRHIGAVEQSTATSGDLLLHESVRGTAIKALQLAFNFARAEATLLNRQHTASAAEGDAGQSTTTRMQQSAAKAIQRVATLESGIAALDATMDRASGRARTILVARRKQLAAQLELAKQIREAVQGLVTFAGAVTSDATGGLAAQIDQLERSVPEAARSRQRSPAVAPVADSTAGAGSQPHTEAAGIAGLVNELFTLSRARRQVTHVIGETDTLLKSLGNLRTPLGRDLRGAIRRSDALAAEPASDDLKQLDAARAEIEILGSSFKQLSAAAIPLREQAMLMETSRGTLTEWKEALDQRYNTAVRYALLRVAVLAIAIGLVLGFSELWRRMTFRYIREARRRRQFLVLRRVAVTGAITLVVMLGLVTEIGSLATYAGFLTAGLALALQSPILSIVGYFLLIGRYGLRVGDRVTITGVTGEVVDIGLVRMYLMELAGTGEDRHATGRIVVFSNSVLFQPSALFKQMPGTDYVWHTITLTLAPETDCQLADRKLTEAVDAVYEQYRGTIEQQHAAFERSVDIKIAPPRPEGRLKFSDAGLEFTARYPAEFRRGAEMDDRVLKALSEAIAREPGLMLAASGTPKLVEAK